MEEVRSRWEGSARVRSGAECGDEVGVDGSKVLEHFLKVKKGTRIGVQTRFSGFVEAWKV